MLVLAKIPNACNSAVGDEDEEEDGARGEKHASLSLPPFFSLYLLFVPSLLSSPPFPFLFLSEWFYVSVVELKFTSKDRARAMATVFVFVS